VSTDNIDRGDELAPDKTAEELAAEAAKKAAEEAEADKNKVIEAEDDELETEEEKAEREREEKKKRARIPLQRHEEILAKARAREEALQEQLRQVQSSKTEAQQNRNLQEMNKKLDELEDKYEDLVLDGKRDEARAVRKEARELRDQISEFKISTSSTQARVQAIETLKFESALARAESEYPEINPDHNDFDEGLTDEVADLTDSLVRTKRLARHEAFARAVKYVLGEPKKAAAKDEGAKDKAKERTTDARQRAKDAVEKQPANLADSGKDTDKGGKSGGAINVMALSQAAFDKLDDETKAMNRGDVL
jgi:DNA repair exonuclease SbcCD ATPase subunit